MLKQNVHVHVENEKIDSKMLFRLRLLFFSFFFFF